MSNPLPKTTTRRDFLKHTGTIAAASALAATFVPHVHAAEDSTIQAGIDRLWRSWHGCRCQCAGRQEGADQAGRHGGRV